MMAEEIERKVIELIVGERIRQDVKWGEQNHPDLYWLGILMEEVGEVAKAVIEKAANVREEKCAKEVVHLELVQVAAVAVAWLECIERSEQLDKEDE